MISDNNLVKIKKLSDKLSDEITSFLIFESRLNSYEAKSDFCFAVSSNNGEREILYDSIKNKRLPPTFLEKTEWKQLGNFTEKWVNPKSMLYDSIIGLWFEFDTASNISDNPAPSIFIQPKTDHFITGEITAQHKLLTKTALPLLLGKPLSSEVEKKVTECIKKLPLEASLFQVGTMLSRKNPEIRIVIKRMKAEEIIPLLTFSWMVRR